MSQCNCIGGLEIQATVLFSYLENIHILLKEKCKIKYLILLFVF